MSNVWEMSFAEFAGPGIHHPSDSMRVDDDEAKLIVADLAVSEGVPTMLRPVGRQGRYVLGQVAGAAHTLLLADKRIVGFYAGSYLWIDRAHRGHGLSRPLILAAARHRAGRALPPGVVFQGYTGAGLAAHRSAHARAVGAAIAAGLPVPAPVQFEWQAQTARCAPRSAA
jgi:GNAT superfamily N-acetyltransferase